MEILKTEIEGVYLIKNKIFSDERGIFRKIFHKEIFEKNNLCSEFKESYYSISKKDVIRGMHFQLPPHDHEKLVYVSKGAVLDVVLDLRKNSPTYGKSLSFELTSENGLSLYIAKGLAHGFKSLEENTIMTYNVATVYNQESDEGIKWDSFGHDWECENPIISKRDKEFEKFDKNLEIF